MICKSCDAPLLKHEQDLCLGCETLAKREAHQVECDLCSVERPGEVYDQELAGWAEAPCGYRP